MLKAGIYVRLSKEDLHSRAEESESIENQKKLLKEYAYLKGWEVYKIYSDDNESGKYADEDDQRSGFRNMINDAKDGKFDCVLCKTQSRFSRNATMIEKYVEHLFPQWGVRFVTVVDNADNFDKRNKKARQINSLVNEWFLEDLSENIKEVYRYKMKNGEYLAPFPPFGYIKNPDIKNSLLPDVKYARFVKEIFNMYLEGLTCEKIADILNQRRIESPGMLTGKGKGEWRPDSVYRILKNKTYIGSTHQHKEETYSYKSRKRRKIPLCDQIEVANTHEAIVDKDTFIKVQKILGERKYNRKNPRFSGILKCGKCGKNMHSNTNMQKKRYYRCKNKCCAAKVGICEDFVLEWQKENPPFSCKYSINAIYHDKWILNYCINS